MPHTKTPLKYSLAYWYFKKDFTSVNDLFWLLECQSDLFKHMLEVYNIETPLSDIIKIQRKNLSKYPKNLEIYNDRFLNFNILSYYYIVVCLCSSFEVYIKSIFSAALTYNPILLDGCASFDVMKYIKYGNAQFDKRMKKKLDNFTKGTWDTRAKNIMNTFGVLNAVFSQDIIDKLDILRKYRNSASHTFMKELDSIDYTSIFSAIEMQKISNTDIIDAMTTIYNIANKIDNLIVDDNIKIVEFLFFIKKELPASILEKIRLNPGLYSVYKTKLYKKLGGEAIANANLQNLVKYYINI